MNLVSTGAKDFDARAVGGAETGAQQKHHVVISRCYWQFMVTDLPTLYVDGVGIIHWWVPASRRAAGADPAVTGGNTSKAVSPSRRIYTRELDDGRNTPAGNW